MNRTPYLHSDVPTRQMAGKGAPRPTVFGVLGHTMEDPHSKSLGGLVKNSKASAPPPPTSKDSKKSDHTEHKIAGSPSKTPIPGAHMGQVPYAGVYMSALGNPL